MQSPKNDLKYRAFLFSLDIIKFLEQSGKDYISQTMGKQLLRCATSIGANIIEAQAAPSKKDFANFFNIALKSANETKYWLYLFQKTERLKDNQLLNEVTELSNILAKSLLTMRGK